MQPSLYFLDTPTAAGLIVLPCKMYPIFCTSISVFGSPVLLQVPPGWEGAWAGVARDLRLVLAVLANTLQQENNQTQRLSTQQRPGRSRGHYKGGS